MLLDLTIATLASYFFWLGIEPDIGYLHSLVNDFSASAVLFYKLSLFIGEFMDSSLYLLRFCFLHTFQQSLSSWHYRNTRLNHCLFGRDFITHFPVWMIERLVARRVLDLGFGFIAKWPAGRCKNEAFDLSACTLKGR